MCLPAGARRRVEQALLRQQHIRPLGVPAAADGALGGGDLRQRAAEVNGRRPGARRRRPGDRPVQRPVDLEHAGAVAVALELRGGSRPAAGRRRARSSWRGVTSSSTRAPAAARPATRPARRSRSRRRASAGSAPARRRCACEPPRGDRPADGVAASAEHQPDGGRRRRAPAAASRGRPGRRTGARARSPRSAGLGQAARRAERAQPEARQRRRDAAAARSGREERRAAACPASRTSGPISRRYAAASPPSVAPVASTERSSTAAVPSSSGWASGAAGWIQLEPVLGERQRAEERRADAERVDRRADIVDEARQRQLGRARPAADVSARLEHQHRAPGARQRDRRRQPVRARRRRRPRPASYAFSYGA